MRLGPLSATPSPLQNNTPMIRIGITGGIGSGKSYVCRLLEQRGCPVFCCDSEARRLMLSDPSLRDALVRLIGRDAYLPDGSLNKAAVGAYLFADAAHAARVNALVHPRVRDTFLRWADGRNEPVVALECAILRQSHFDELVDVVVRVTAPTEVRVNRVVRRDGHAAAEVRRRIEAQTAAEPPAQPDELVVRNDGTADLSAEVDRLLEQIKRTRR